MMVFYIDEFQEQFEEMFQIATQLDEKELDNMDSEDFLAVLDKWAEIQQQKMSIEPDQQKQQQIFDNLISVIQRYLDYMRQIFQFVIETTPKQVVKEFLQGEEIESDEDLAQQELKIQTQQESFVQVLSNTFANLRFHNTQLFNQFNLYTQNRKRAFFDVQTPCAISRLVTEVGPEADEKLEIMQNLVRIAKKGHVEDGIFQTKMHIDLFYYFSSVKNVEQETLIQLYKILILNFDQEFCEELNQQRIMSKKFYYDFLKLGWAYYFCQAKQIDLTWPKNTKNQKMRIEKNALFQKSRTHKVIQVDVDIGEAQENPIFQNIFEEINKYFGDKKLDVDVQFCVKFGTNYSQEFFVPILVKYGDKQIAVEPIYHDEYILNVPDQIICTKQAKLDVLEFMGYEVFTISYEKWKQNQLEYQKKILSKLNEQIMEQKQGDE
eukprot:TRINITY_DN12055_c0_g1_i1.p2 TRINITY_DN12055_c0_g1~~TRINITY_DN12055_c0_g1_i1.p2  ORF type:complete len:502 (+),score=68.70 TRINITY_DN12055_c0_g1_i1:204-1508(+)